IRVEAENIQNGIKKHCNSSYFTMVAVNDNGKTIAVPGLKITSKMDAKRFIKAIKRRESEIKKDKVLGEIYKNVDEHLELLQDYRVEISFK
ncbi:MAG: acyl-CoA thioesterase, partial [Winogradskyella sp.]|nr:acyl-CoA thioesterase [Winogradskyella sp.]